MNNIRKQTLENLDAIERMILKNERCRAIMSIAISGIEAAKEKSLKFFIECEYSKEEAKAICKSMFESISEKDVEQARQVMIESISNGNTAENLRNFRQNVINNN